MPTRQLFFCFLITLLCSKHCFSQTITGNPLQGLSQLKPYETERVASTDPNWQHGNGDSRFIAPGATLTLAQLNGPGKIVHFWNTVADNETYWPELLVLRIYWDGEKNPSVQCPLGDFFGVGFGRSVPFTSLPVRVTSDGRGRNCYWPMPFRKSALITITNEGTEPVNAFYYYLDWQKWRHLPRTTAYFHAVYRQEFPCTSGKNYQIANIQGSGHYVGTVLSCWQRSPGWWGEGNDWFTIDGESEPRLKGTGTEDYFCDGWGLRQQSGPFYGAPLVQPDAAGSITSAYRWHIPDPVVFHKSLRVEIQHMGVVWNADGSFKSGFGERSDDYSSVAFWYQQGPHRPDPVLPYGYARLPLDIRSTAAGSTLLPAAKASQGSVTAQNLGFTAGAQLWWQPGNGNQKLTMPVQITKSGLYDLTLFCTYAHDYGIYAIALDGKQLGAPADFYAQSIAIHRVTRMNLSLTAGTHQLEFTGRGHNPVSIGYMFGLDGILFTPEENPTPQP